MLCCRQVCQPFYKYANEVTVYTQLLTKQLCISAVSQAGVFNMLVTFVRKQVIFTERTNLTMFISLCDCFHIGYFVSCFRIMMYTVFEFHVVMIAD